MIVDERINAVESCVSCMQHIRFHEAHRDVAVGVSRRIVLEGDRLTIEMKRSFVQKDDSR